MKVLNRTKAVMGHSLRTNLVWGCLNGLKFTENLEKPVSLMHQATSSVNIGHLFWSEWFPHRDNWVVSGPMMCPWSFLWPPKVFGTHHHVRFPRQNTGRSEAARRQHYPHAVWHLRPHLVLLHPACSFITQFSVAGKCRKNKVLSILSICFKVKQRYNKDRTLSSYVLMLSSKFFL